MPNPLNIISTLLPSAAVDYVAVFDQNFNQLFVQARSIKAIVKEQSKLMEHPLENGATLTDHRIIQPIEIELSLILASADYQDVYKQIRQYYLKAGLLVVQTRAGLYENQLIEAMPHEEDPNMFNALTIALKLKQILFVAPQFGIAPRFPSNSTTVNRGTQTSTAAPPAQQTTALQDLVYTVPKKIEALFG